MSQSGKASGRVPFRVGSQQVQVGGPGRGGFAWGALAIVSIALMGDSVAQTHSEPDEVTVGVLRNWPPHYLVSPNGEPGGFAVDVMDAVASQAGLRVRYLPFDTYTDMAQALRDGSIDVIPNFGVLEERQSYAAFTAPVETFSIGIFVRSDSHEIESMDDLRDVTVAAVEINAAIGLLRERGMNVEVYPTLGSAMGDLLAGQIDALAFPSSVLWARARQMRIASTLREIGPPLAEVKRAMATRVDDRELASVLGRAVESYVGTDDYHKTYQLWYGSPSSFWTVRRVALSGVTAFAILLIGLAVWRYRLVVRHNRELRRRIDERDAAQMALLVAIIAQRQLERQLRQVQRLEALGRLAGSIAHDFNNLLTIMGATAYLIQHGLDNGVDVQRDVADLTDAVSRAEALVAQLLDFSRQRTTSPQLIEPAKAIVQAEPLLQRALGTSIDLALRVKSTRTVSMDPSRLDQIMFNLASNASDSMPKGGRFEIEVNDQYIAEHPVLTDGDYVVIVACDNGSGIASDDISQVFDPFFTTKPSGEGTGLGLATCYGIAAQTGGHMAVSSQVGSGTRFTIYLPCSAKDVEIGDPVSLALSGHADAGRGGG